MRCYLHKVLDTTDLCCGPGRHSLELARSGLRVTGVDRTAAYLEAAQRKANQEDLQIEYIEDDMRRFIRSNEFDAVIMMYTSFGYFKKADENEQVLNNVRSSLKGGGALLIDVMGKEVLARIFRERDWSEEGGKLLLQERRVSQDWSWMENRWILLDGQDRYEYNVTHWLYSASELSALLKENGFKSVDVYGDLAGAPYDQNAKRLVTVAHK